MCDGGFKNMAKFIDLTGERFDRWYVEGLWEPTKKAYWRCRCDCGTTKKVLGDNLRSGKSLSCGCYRLDVQTKHGMIDHPAYASCKAAKSRCANKNDWNYQNYGARGIKFDPKWNEFSAFWADMGSTWYPGATLDREDVNGDYTASNCKWSTSVEQANNRRDSILVPTPDGPMTILQAAKKFGINPKTLTARISAGWPQNSLLNKTNRHYHRHHRKPSVVKESSTIGGAELASLSSRLRGMLSMFAEKEWGTRWGENLREAIAIVEFHEDKQGKN